MAGGGFVGSTGMNTASAISSVRPISEVLSYTNARLLDRYQRDFGLSAEIARLRFEGLKQFLYVCAVTPGYKVTSDSIDSMWHTFLLFTKDYSAFCETYFGRFINHDPFEVPSPDSYLKTRAAAEELFGSLDEELWPADAKISCSSGCE